MPISMYDASVPVFRQMLGALAAILRKAEAHAEARKIEPDALLQSRLYPDMFPLTRQVEIACDFARGVTARLAGREPLSIADGHRSFAELQDVIARTLAFVESLPAAEIESGASREVVLRAGTQKEKRFGGSDYLVRYGLPQFFFHVTTAYALLRHAGIEVGKKDYMGLA